MQSRSKGMQSSAAKTAMSGLLVAIALIFSYIETLIPVVIPVPGAKIGLANLVTLTGLFFLPAPQVFLILIVRIILSGFMFGSFSTIMYSLAGGIVSFCFMYMAKRIGLFSPLGVSITGAVFHNLGQLGVACLVLNSFAPFVYLPYLILLGAVTGTFIGMIGKIIEKANKR